MCLCTEPYPHLLQAPGNAYDPSVPLNPTSTCCRPRGMLTTPLCPACHLRLTTLGLRTGVSPRQAHDGVYIGPISVPTCGHVSSSLDLEPQGRDPGGRVVRQSLNPDLDPRPQTGMALTICVCCVHGWLPHPLCWLQKITQQNE